MLPERHRWKPAVQTAAVMLRTPPSPASHRPAARADPAPSRPFALCRHIAGWTQGCVGFALCCHSNATRAPIANPTNSAQLGGSLYHAPKLRPGPCSIVGVRPRSDRHTQTHRQTDRQKRVTTIHFASSTTHVYSSYCHVWTLDLLARSLDRINSITFVVMISQSRPTSLYNNWVFVF